MDSFPFARLESYRLARMQVRLCSRILGSLPEPGAVGRELGRHYWRPGLLIARGTAELTRDHAVQALTDAREHTRLVLRLLRFLRRRRAGDQARITAAVEIAERLRERLAADIVDAECGCEPWQFLPGEADNG